jgi:N-acetylglucosaminyldiphosphoundecaprenol N-acetyl-beta-D-mannosaminyltransferase
VVSTAAATPLDLPVRPIGGVPFRIAELPTAIDALCRVSQAPVRGLAVHFANAYSVAIAADDPDYRDVLADPTAATFSDGVPVTWVGRRAYPEHAARWQRVYGPDVMTGVFDRCQADALAIRHFLLGGSPQALTALGDAISRRWPGVDIAGSTSPPFRRLTAAESAVQRQLIADSGATMVWVGLGTPKQDFAARDLAQALPATVLAVGAAFDFIGGTKPQAPRWMQRSGTEWIYRLAREPRRLTRRYLWGNPRFVLAAAQQPGLRLRQRSAE